MPRGIKRSIKVEENQLENLSQSDMMKSEETISNPEIEPTDEVLKIEELMNKIAELETKNTELLEELKKIREEKEPEVVLEAVENTEETPVDPYVECVKEICGKDFETQIEPVTSVNFKLTIIPPTHLREMEGDRRVKVISNIEGLAGVRAYAERVKTFCVIWAQKNGVNYEKN